MGAGLLLGALPLSIRAATIVWENSAIGFNAGANWIGGTAPGAGDIGSFQAATASFNPRLTASKTVGGLEFTSGTAAWTFTGTAGGAVEILTIGSSGIVSNDNSTQTFNNANLGIALGANTAFTSNSTGALTFGGNLASFSLSTFTLTLDGSSTNAVNRIIEPISGTGGITKDGTGTWLLSGANTFSGKTIINNGVLAITAETGLGANPGASVADQLTLNGGTLRTQTNAVTINDANREITLGASGGTFDTVTNLTIANTNIISGSGELTKTGAGSLTISGTSTYTGGTTISAGTLAMGAGNILSSGAVTVDGGTAVLAMGSNQSDTVGTVSVANGGSITGTGTSTLTSTGTFEMQSGSVTARLGGAGIALNKTTAGTVTLSGANTYTGATTISAGTLQLTASNVLSDSTAVSVASGATFDVNGQTETIASLAGAGDVSLGTGALTTAGNADTTFSGTLGGTGSFTKGGTGILTLDTDLTFNGTFNLAGGTLRLTDMVLDVDTFNLTGNSTIDFAGASSQLLVTNLNLNGFTLNITNWSNVVDFFYAANWNGAVTNTRGIAPMNQVTFNGFTANDTQWQSYDSQVTPVPEPAAYGVLLFGALTALMAWRKLRRVD